MRPPDPAFADPRLAALYDALDDDRGDLDVYVDLVDELGAHSVVDIGCGTGSLAVRLGSTGLSVIGLDPALASLDVARAKLDAGRVTWVEGDATALDGLDRGADLALMTGNVAQVFTTDDDWARTLGAVHRCLRERGWFVFESRRPEARDWEHWDLAPTTVALPDGGTAVVTRTVVEVTLPLVTFRTTTTVAGETIPSTSTLIFRGREQIERDLDRHGFEVVEVRDAPDRRGKEYVFIARRADH